MGGAVKTSVIALIARQAMFFDDFSRGLSEAEYLGRISCRLYMGAARSVASFTGNSLSIVLQSEFGVRIRAQAF